MRTNWITVFSSKLGNGPFSVEEVQEATGNSREAVLSALRKYTGRGILVKRKNGSYEIRNLNKIGVVKDFIQDISVRFGDSKFSIDSVMEVSGGKKQTLHARLWKMKKDGLVVHVGPGVYRLTDKAHNMVAPEFKKKVEQEREPKCLPSCVLIKMESVLGEERMKNWVYAVAMKSEECVTVLEAAAVESIARLASPASGNGHRSAFPST